MGRKQGKIIRSFFSIEFVIDVVGIFFILFCGSKQFIEWLCIYCVIIEVKILMEKAFISVSLFPQQEEVILLFVIVYIDISSPSAIYYS